MRIIEKLSKVPFFKKILDNEAIMYVIVGGCSTFVNLFIYWILTFIFGENKQTSVIFNFISVFCAIIFAFFTNKIFVFKSKSDCFAHAFQEFYKFVGARLTTMAIEIGGVYLLYNIMNINSLLAKFLTQFIVLVVNFFISKFIVFKK